MQPQPDILQPFSERCPHMPGLTLSHTVHHRIIGEPLKLDRRKLAFQPRVKRIMHEKISQYR